ncbi:M28 family peptidase [uncultured Brevundimonas sp.]|uniref:M28 family peptidase n=1 Tax=uncultured Brevundimonas sp. TaxID=213418 RepID=UPI00260339E9|nr:M28 family peptidase [uncultured Brevundimonas sp.]
MSKFGKAVSALAIAVALSASTAVSLQAQEREDRTLLSWDELHAIINEASGDRALHTVLEGAPFPRMRPREEYESNFRENLTVARLAREYGLSDVTIESFPTPRGSWRPIKGELWLQGDRPRKLYDINDVIISVAPNSESGEVVAEVIDVGVGGRPEDYEGLDLRGKVVLGTANPSTLQRLAVLERGALGVISANVLRIENPDFIMESSIAKPPAGQSAGFAWVVSATVGRELSTKIGRGETVTIRSVIEAEDLPGEIETVHAVIRGDGSTDQAIIYSAHLHEGYIKQGANDNSSGSATILEMARTYAALIEQGKLPRPRRDVHFLWVPEISGTMAWLDAHPEIEGKVIADMNFDMEGIGLTAGGAQWVLYRTPDTFPTYLNDVGQSVGEWLAAVNTERVRFRDNGYQFTLPVLSHNGSRDPFYFATSKHYGSSDHSIYLNRGIPALIFATWPDPWYHSSADTPDKLDPTMMRRAVVAGVSAMSVLASADDEGAARVMAESLARGVERLGFNQRKGLGYLADAKTGAELLEAYREAANAVTHQQAIEKAVITSTNVLFNNPTAAAPRLREFTNLIDQRAKVLQDEVTAFYRLRASQLGVRAVAYTPTAADREAANLVASRVPGGQMFGRRGRNDVLFASIPEADRAAVIAGYEKLPQHMAAELTTLLSQGKTVLEIRDFLAGQFDPLPTQDLLDYLKAAEKIGGVKLTPRR